jgi:hypothetical protein
MARQRPDCWACVDECDLLAGFRSATSTPRSTRPSDHPAYAPEDRLTGAADNAGERSTDDEVVDFNARSVRYQIQQQILLSLDPPVVLR